MRYHRDGSSGGAGGDLGAEFGVDAFAFGGPLVEDHEVAGREAEAEQVAVELANAGLGGIRAAGAMGFDLQRLALDGGFSVGSGVVSADEEVHGAAADTVFTVDETIAVDGAVEVSEQSDMGSHFTVGLVGGEEVLGAVPELGEAGEERG